MRGLRLPGLRLPCDDYRDYYTDDYPHPYISLLAVNPAKRGQGFGAKIVRHLIGEAAVRVRRGGCHDILFLDVYESSEAAIRLYTRSGFTNLTPEPIPDEAEGAGGKRYLIMALRVSSTSA